MGSLQSVPNRFLCDINQSCLMRLKANSPDELGSGNLDSLHLHGPLNGPVSMVSIDYISHVCQSRRMCSVLSNQHESSRDQTSAGITSTRPRGIRVRKKSTSIYSPQTGVTSGKRMVGGRRGGVWGVGEKDMGLLGGSNGMELNIGLVQMRRKENLRYLILCGLEMESLGNMGLSELTPAPARFSSPVSGVRPT